MRRTLVLLTLFLLNSASLRAQQFSLVIDSKRNMKELRDVVGDRFTFICKANLQMEPIYGTDQYTDDSPICTAAVHAGVITREKGGPLTLVIQEGQAGYPASNRNGVASASWTSYDRHYVFVKRSGGQIDWGTSATKLPSDFNTPLDLFCPPGAPAYLTTKVIYGTDIYSDTSPICVAAVHAGVITLAGGDVRVTPRGPQSSYTASSRRGITSRSYGAWDASYSVDRVGSPARESEPGALTGEENPALRISPASFPLSNPVAVTVDSLDNVIGRTLRYAPIIPVDSLDNMIGRIPRNPRGPGGDVIGERVDSLDNIVARIVYPQVSNVSITRSSASGAPRLSLVMRNSSGGVVPGANIEMYSLPVKWTSSSQSCAFTGGATGPEVVVSSGCSATITATITRPVGAPSSLAATKSATFQLRP